MELKYLVLFLLHTYVRRIFRRKLFRIMNKKGSHLMYWKWSNHNIMGWPSAITEDMQEDRWKDYFRFTIIILYYILYKL